MNKQLRRRGRSSEQLSLTVAAKRNTGEDGEEMAENFPELIEDTNSRAGKHK